MIFLFDYGAQENYEKNEMIKLRIFYFLFIYFIQRICDVRKGQIYIDMYQPLALFCVAFNWFESICIILWRYAIQIVKKIFIYRNNYFE